MTCIKCMNGVGSVQIHILKLKADTLMSLFQSKSNALENRVKRTKTVLQL